ncbi:hypothetical protein V9N52_004277 [Vibrio navarrensis]
MKYALLILMLFSLGVDARSPDKKQYQQCVDDYLTQAERPIVSNEIKSACRALYDSYSVLSDNDERYYQCLLERMPASQNARATKEIKQGCEEVFRGLFD